MSFNACRENKILAKISEPTVRFEFASSSRTVHMYMVLSLQVFLIISKIKMLFPNRGVHGWIQRGVGGDRAPDPPPDKSQKYRVS